MKVLLAILGLGLFLPSGIHAIPNVFFSNGTNQIPVIPAFPRFNADLTEEFLDAEPWKTAEFSGPWEKEPSLPDLEIRRMSAMPVLFGEVPMSVHSYESAGAVQELVIHFLDAGLYFGYFSGETTKEERDEMRSRRHEFGRHFKELSETLQDRLEEGCGRGTEGKMGATPVLSMQFTDYYWEDFTLRYVEREDHSISLHLFRRGQEPKSLVESAWGNAGRRDRQELLEQRVVERSNGSMELVDFPVFSQGSTPFCGIHSLAMVGHYLGLRTDPGMLAASADFKNTGSAAGSDMIEVHRAVASELDLNLSMAPRFDVKRVERSIADGLPVLVWRRVSSARENHHRKIAGTDAAFEPMTSEELKSLPSREVGGSPSHASVVTGLDPASRAVMYVEPWGHDGRDRRMSVEEMERTVYAVFYFKL